MADVCLFCNNPADSKEHLFPDWLNRLMSDEPTTYFRGSNQNGWRSWGSARVATQELRVVCEGCNTGWMSKLERAAKPILSPMILGQRIQLDPDQQVVIAAWAFVRAVVGTQMDKSHTIPKTQRDWVKANNSAPSQAMVGVATTDASWWDAGDGRKGNLHFSDMGMYATTDSTSIQADLVQNALIGYSATILIRHFAVQVVGSVTSNTRFEYPEPIQPFIAILPTSEDLDWPSTPPMPALWVERLVSTWRGNAPYIPPFPKADQTAKAFLNRNERRAQKARRRRP